MENVKVNFGSVLVEEGVENPFVLEYSLLSGKGDTGDDVFGVEVAKADQAGTRLEEIRITDFASVREIAEKLLRLLMNGLVTPVSVFDVTEDFLGVEYGI